MKELLDAVHDSSNVSSFVFKIQNSEFLRNQLYAWEKRTPERKELYKSHGWSKIATDFFEQTKDLINKKLLKIFVANDERQ